MTTTRPCENRTPGYAYLTITSTAPEVGCARVTLGTGGWRRFSAPLEPPPSEPSSDTDAALARSRSRSCRAGARREASDA